MTLLDTNTVEASSNTGTLTTDFAVPAGDVVIVSVVWEGTGIPASIAATDARGNTYTLDESRGAANTTVACAILRGTIVTPLQVNDVITVTIGTTRTRWMLQADSDTGFDASPLDQHTGQDNPGSSGSPSTGTTGTTTQANERAYMVIGIGRGSSQNFTGVGGWSSTAQVNTVSGTTPRGMQVAYTTLSATGTVQGTATLSAPASYVAAVVTYKLAGTPKAGSDSGTASESAALEAAVPATDTGTATEAASLAAEVSGSDTATATESAEVTIIGEVTYSMAIDWNGDGALDGPGEDVLERVLASGGFSAQYGREQSRALAPIAPGRASFDLNNLSRDYSPDNADSPLAGDLLPARELLATAELNSVVHTIFRGSLDDFTPKVERNSFRVECTALDALAKLKGAKVSTQLHQAVQTGEAIDLLLDAVGWPSGLRDLDVGATTIRWWWEHDADAFDALMKLVNSEGPGAIVHADEEGRIVFRDRHHRLTRTASTTSQATITDGLDGYEPAFSAPWAYDHGWKDIINSVAFSVEERDPSPYPETVHEEEDQVRSIPASETLIVDVVTSDPILIPEVSFTTLTGTITPSVTQVNARTLQIELTAGVTAAALQGLVVTAYPVAVRRTYQVSAEDAASQDKYGMRSPTSVVEAPWAGVHDAYAIAQLLVGQRSERLPTISFRMVGAGVQANTRLEQQLGRDLSDRLHITETQTGLDHDFYLEQIQHRITGGGVLETTFGLEQAATQVANAFRFNDADHGFDDGVFGTAGLDDPALLFRFDVSGQGFNDGVFAT